MSLLVALVAGLCGVGIVAASGAAGYGIARLGSNRAGVASVSVGALLVIGSASAIGGSLAYTRLSTVAVVTLAEPTPGRSPSPAYLQAVTDGWLHFDSDNGDWVGGGVLKVWTFDDSTFAIGGTNALINARVTGLDDWWNFAFRAPSNSHLWTGRYDNASAWQAAPGSQPGIDITGDGRGCDTVKGRFWIKTLIWTSAATIAEIDIVFEQHCEGMKPALRGELWATTERGVHKSPPPFSSSISI